MFCLSRVFVCCCFSLLIICLFFAVSFDYLDRTFVEANANDVMSISSIGCRPFDMRFFFGFRCQLLLSVILGFVVRGIFNKIDFDAIRLATTTDDDAASNLSTVVTVLLLMLLLFVFW
jgi:hypothetical protein